MRMFLDESLLKTLTDKVLHQFGRKNLLPADCKVLSGDIYSKTEKSISETTLKRLFGFAKRSFDFSIYTLDTLAIYLGYENWNSFYELNQTPAEKQLNGGNKWQELKNLCTKHSQYTLQAVKNSSGIQFTKTIEREKLTAFIKKFLLTNKSIAPIVAPSGSGKSIGLTHTALKLWLSETPVYSNDICCFINIHQIHTIATYKHSLFEWFNKYLGLMYQDVHVLEAEKNKEDKLVLIIDGFDERAFSTDKLKLIYANIIEFINFNNEYSWIKIILSLRPSAWAKLVQAYFNPSFFLNRIFIDESFPNENYQNHTLPFSQDEIETILDLHQQERQETAGYSPDFFQLISFPRYLDILCNLLINTGYRKQSQEHLVYKIIETDIKHYFLFDTHTSVKSRIIEKLVELKLSPQSATGTDLKEWTLVKDSLTATAFCQLIDDYLIIEEKEFSNGAFHSPKINFTNQFIENYFISWFSLKQNNYTVSRNLVDVIYASDEFAYSKEPVIKWYLVHFLQTGNLAAIQEIFYAKSITAAERFALFEFLVEQAETEKQKNDILAKLEQEHHFARHFFTAELHLQYLGAEKEKMLSTLYKIDAHKQDKHAFLCLLFINAILQLKIPAAETYLREYRQLSRNDRSTLIASQEKLMEYTLDFARYEFRNDSIQLLVDELAQNSEAVLHENREMGSISLVLLVHALLYTEDYERLLQCTETWKKNLAATGKEQPAFLEKLLQLMHLYAGLMCRELQPSTEKAVVQAVQSLNNVRASHSLLNTAAALLQARLYEKKKDTQQAIQFANKVYNGPEAACLRIYKLLAYHILKETYKMNNEEEKANETDEKIRELFSYKYDEKINYDLKESRSFYSKTKFL